MGSVKRAVRDLVKTLPDNCTIEDVQHQLYVRQKVERSMRPQRRAAFIATSR